MLNKIVENFKLIKKRWKHFWESAMRWLLINYQPSHVVGNTGSTLEKKCVRNEMTTVEPMIIYLKERFSEGVLIEKLFDIGVKVGGTARKNMKDIPEMTFGKTMQKGDHEVVVNRLL